MKLNAVCVSSKDLSATTRFYTLLGFKFPVYKEGEKHIESIEEKGSIRLMIDSVGMIEEILGTKPTPANHSMFAIEYNTPTNVNETTAQLKLAGYTVVKDPWDAFWSQRYAIVEDPDGYKVDLYAAL